MSIDLSPLSVAELTDLGKRIGREIRVRAAQESKELERAAAEKKKEVLNELKKFAAKHGMTLDEVMEGAPKKRGRRASGPKTAKTKSPAKYRNPKDETKTWTGKGRKPGWIVEGLAKGKKLEDFAI